MLDGAGGAEPTAEPPLPAVPEAAEGALPQGPGPAVPPEIAAKGAAAGQAAAEAQPDAASQPVQVFIMHCVPCSRTCCLAADMICVQPIAEPK